MKQEQGKHTALCYDKKTAALRVGELRGPTLAPLYQEADVWGPRIVRAVNSHAALVEACEKAHRIASTFYERGISPTDKALGGGVATVLATVSETLEAALKAAKEE